MMTTVKTILLAAALAAVGNSAFAKMYSGAEAEEIIIDGEIINSSMLGNTGTVLLVGYKSKVFYCFVYLQNITLGTECFSDEPQ